VQRYHHQPQHSKRSAGSDEQPTMRRVLAERRCATARHCPVRTRRDAGSVHRSAKAQARGILGVDVSWSVMAEPVTEAGLRTIYRETIDSYLPAASSTTSSTVCRGLDRVSRRPLGIDDRVCRATIVVRPRSTRCARPTVGALIPIDSDSAFLKPKIGRPPEVALPRDRPACS